MLQNQSALKLNKRVFVPTVLFLILVIIVSLYDNEAFIAVAEQTNQWILDQFG
ncbi:MAG: hypothetical protein AAF985_11945 [Bacteroidota bacterium]